jgi:hypothetical protein
MFAEGFGLQAKPELRHYGFSRKEVLFFRKSAHKESARVARVCDARAQVQKRAYQSPIYNQRKDTKLKRTNSKKTQKSLMFSHIFFGKEAPFEFLKI